MRDYGLFGDQYSSMVEWVNTLTGGKVVGGVKPLTVTVAGHLGSGELVVKPTLWACFYFMKGGNNQRKHKLL